MYAPTHSYQKTVLSENRVLCELIATYGGQALATEATPITLLLDHTITSTFSGPMHAFLKQAIEAYQQLVKARTHLHVLQDPVLNHKNSPDFLAEREALSAILKNNTLQSIAQLTKSFNTCVEQQAQTWHRIAKEWSSAYLAALSSKAHPFSESEINEFQTLHTTYQEIADRFTTLNLAPQESLTPPLHFNQYFNNKAHCLLYDALSRSHLPNQPADIKPLLKPLKKINKHIEKEAKKLLAEDLAAYHTIIAPIMPAT
jgi:hypothetical protein